MSVDDHFAVIAHVVQKVVAYPAQIVPVLLFQWDPGTHTGMNKGKIPYFYQVLAIPQKIDMARGNQSGETRRPSGIA